MVELGIVDIREIIRVIKKVHDVDFSNFALTSFKYSLEKVITKYGLVSTESLYRKISEEPDFFDLFMADIFVPSTEMFRDPSVWRWLREEYFQNVPDRFYDNFKIWVPNCVSGAEIFSLCILLKELNLLSKVKIIASYNSQKNLEYIKSGLYPVKKLEVSIENYTRFKGPNSFSDYYSMVDNKVIRDASLISSVEFIKDDIYFSKAPKNVKLILFRNAMIYYTPSFQTSALQKINNTLSASGTLIIGTKEVIRSGNSGAGFELISANESIYKRKL